MADGFDDDELVKKLEKISENEFNDVIAREKTHANELAKYKAAAADRMSTAAITIGFFAPASAIVLNPGQMMDLNSGRALLVSIATLNWFVLSFALHNRGRYILRKELV